MERPERFELPTLCFEGRCSIQLSYGREATILREVNDGYEALKGGSLNRVVVTSF